MTIYIFFVLGFVILILGAKWLVDGAASLGKRSGLSQMLIGLTVVALGTSLPELVINVFASIEGSTDLAIGNVLGSNIINTLFIIGIAAIIFPIKIPGTKCRNDIIFNLFAVAILGVLANDMIFGKPTNVIDTVDGIILLALLIGFLYFSFSKSEKKPENKEPEQGIKDLSVIKSVGFILAGSLGLFFGGKWIVGGVGQIAIDFNLSKSVIGLTLVAIATSLPELVTSVLAALKKNTDMAVGNAVGSNIFNILLVLGVSAVIKPIEYQQSLNMELGLLVLSGLLLVAFIKLKIGGGERRISKVEGVIMVVLYLLFLVWSLFWQ